MRFFPSLSRATPDPAGAVGADPGTGAQGASAARGAPADGWAPRRHDRSSDIAALRTALNQLKRHRAPQTHDMKKAWLRSLDRRLAAPALSVAARATLDCELRLLDLETRIARKPLNALTLMRGLVHPGVEKDRRTDADLQRLAFARRDFANALMRQLDTRGDLGAALKAHLNDLAQSDPAAHAAALDALDAARHLDDGRHRAVAVQAAADLAAGAQAAQRAAGASTAPREASRMPSDVLVHLASVIDETARRHAGDGALARLADDARRQFLTHGATPASVRALAAAVAGRLSQLGEHAPAQRCFGLAQQLPVRAAREGAPSLNRQQLHENVYGRAFDSLWMANLVQRPPRAVLKAVEDVGAAYATRLPADDDVAAQASAELRSMLKHQQRPWAGAVPGLQPFLRAPDGPKARDALVDYLRSPVVDGRDAVARTYLMVWAGNAFREAAKAAGESDRIPASTRAADANYANAITNQALRDRANVPAGTRGVGIHLAHQPAPVDDPALAPAWRSAAVYRVGRQEGGAKPGDTAGPQFSRAIDVQHERALPFGSGVSGSTNLLMHAFAGLRDDGLHQASARDFLLAAGMMLSYDGGHSLHEVLWTGNQLDRTLGLGVGLSDGKAAPEEFVSDYAAFADGFPPGTRARLREAIDESWAGTQDYLRQHSHFAKADA